MMTRKLFSFFFLVYLTQLEKNELHLKEEKNMFNWSSIDLFWRTSSSAVWFIISLLCPLDWICPLTDKWINQKWYTLS
jgi:hypothetical protein